MEHRDWSDCLSVDLIPSGSGTAAVVRGTSISPDCVVKDYYAGKGIDDLSHELGVSSAYIEDLLSYAARTDRERDDPPAVRVDWRGCNEVERVLGRMGGVPVLANSRIEADSIVEQFMNGSGVEEIVFNFGLRRDTVEAVLAFALRSRFDLAS